MNSKELKKILKLHKLWLEGKPAGIRADLRHTDLRHADLEGANLRKADLGGANLRCADLRKADLGGANLTGADLSKANLSYADLRGAILYSANLREADLRGADLEGANLTGADLDFSCLPLSCKGLNIKIDKKIAIQLLLHALNQDCDDEEFLVIKNDTKVINFLKQFHRLSEITYTKERN